MNYYTLILNFIPIHWEYIQRCSFKVFYTFNQKVLG